MFDLAGKVAIVTGSSRGIGRAIADQMARAGARVVVSSRKPEACDTVVDGIRAAGGTAVSVGYNTSHRDQLDHLVERTVGEWGRLDVLVCNAAVDPYFGPMATMPDDKIVNSNVRAAFWPTSPHPTSRPTVTAASSSSPASAATREVPPLPYTACRRRRTRHWW